MENLYYNIKKKGGIVYLRKFVDDSKICELHQKGLSHKEIAAGFLRLFLKDLLERTIILVNVVKKTRRRFGSSSY